MSFETEVRERLRTVARQTPLPPSPLPTEIVGRSRRRRLTNRAMTAVVSAALVGVALLLGLSDGSGSAGDGQLIAAGPSEERHRADPAAVEGILACGPAPCRVAVVSADIGEPMAMVGGEGAGGAAATELLEMVDGSRWLTVTDDLPDDFAAYTLVRDGDRYLLGGSLPSPSGVDRPAIATSTDLRSWSVQVLDFERSAPAGYQLASQVDSILVTDSVVLAAGSAIDLTPEPPNDSPELDAATARMLDLRPKWRAEPGERFKTEPRTDANAAWDVVGSDGHLLVAVTRGRLGLVTSTSADAEVWASGGVLPCADGQVEADYLWPGVTTGGPLVVAGYCGGEVVVWSSDDDAATWTARQLGVGRIRSFTASPAGVAVSIELDSRRDVVVFSADGSRWHEVSPPAPGGSGLLSAVGVGGDEVYVVNGWGELVAAPIGS